MQHGYRRGATRNVGDGKIGPCGVFLLCVLRCVTDTLSNRPYVVFPSELPPHFAFSLAIPIFFWQGEHEYIALAQRTFPLFFTPLQVPF